MKSTSLGSRLVRIAARSPARSSTGPEVERRLTPISRAMMWASVVLPSPGGPKRSTWSSASLRVRAADTKISSCSRIFAWPTYSARSLGRRARSSAISWGEAGATEIRRSASIIAFPSWLRQELQRLANRIGERKIRSQLLHRALRLALIVAKAEERIDDVAARGRSVGARAAHREGQPVAQLQHEALGGLLADAGNLGEARRILRGHRRREVVHRKSGEHRERDLGTHATDFQELAKRGALARGEEAVEQVRILAHHHVREERHVLARARKMVEGAHRHVDLVAHAVGDDDHLWRVLLDQLAEDAPDHGPRALTKGALRAPACRAWARRPARGRRAHGKSRRRARPPHPTSGGRGA